jgi:hypothetical protein
MFSEGDGGNCYIEQKEGWNPQSVYIRDSHDTELFDSPRKQTYTDRIFFYQRITGILCLGGYS